MFDILATVSVVFLLSVIFCAILLAIIYKREEKENKED